MSDMISMINASTRASYLNFELGKYLVHTFQFGKVNSKVKALCLIIMEKVSFNIASEASYVYKVH